MKFTFKVEHECGETMTLEVDKLYQLEQVLSAVERFLCGAGFVIDGNLEVYNEFAKEEPTFDSHVATGKMSLSELLKMKLKSEDC